MPNVTADILATYTSSDGVALGELVRKGDVTPGELAEAAILLIEKLNPQLNAVVHKLYDVARSTAPTVDRTALFAGVPYLLKESGTMWAGTPLTSASRWMKDVVATKDAEVVRRIKAAGFVLVGKTNAPENGWSIATEPVLYGPTKNPWREGISPGGSSGGSSAAAAAGLVPVAEASDGAGSIRVPASCCGVVGLKPSRGRLTVSPGGDAWYGCAYDLCVSRTVRDTAAYLDSVAGMLPGDPYFAPVPDASWLSLSQQAPKNLRIGFSLHPPDGGLVHPEVKAAVQRTMAVLEKLGHTVEEHDLPASSAEIWPTYTRMTAVHTARGFAARTPLVGKPVTAEDVEPVTWAVIERGRSVSGVQHSADIEAVRLMSRTICMDLDAYDIYVTPTILNPPPKLGFLDMSEPDIDAYNSRWTEAPFMWPFNISGQPAISLPLHTSSDGLPIGIQLIGRFGDEAGLLALSTVLEHELPWRDRRPAIAA